MKKKNKSVVFDGARVVDSLHYELLKQQYSDKILCKNNVDEEFQNRRSIYASIIIELDQKKQESVSDDILLKRAEVLPFNQLLPPVTEGVFTQVNQTDLKKLNDEFSQILRGWGEPQVKEFTRLWVRRIFELLLEKNG